MKLSKFGEKFTRKSGILELMDDLGKAMGGSDKKYMLGGGNPAHIKEIQKIFRTRMEEIMEDSDSLEKLIGNYDTPQGDSQFLKSMAAFLKKEYGWNITEKNIAITPGSQSGFFILFNMLAGEFSDGSKKKILLPLCPEYIGYADQGLSEDFFVSYKASIEFISKHEFKYHVDFDKLKITDDIAAICVSRPTNPTGNVLTDEEINKLSKIAKQKNIPFIIDNAYGAPFPNIIFNEVKPVWDENIILTMSLSKLGMPSIRTGIIVAKEEIIQKIAGINAIISLANTRLGQAIVTPLLDDSSIIEISKKHITPYYESKSKKAQEYIKEFFNDEIPYYVHKSEGCLFLWLWFKDMPISSKELYQRLKKRNVIVVPGEYFFPGLNEEWDQTQECIRMSFAMEDADVKMGIKIIGEEIEKAYNS
jgi:valine--pyruvate aminotransferase